MTNEYKWEEEKMNGGITDEIKYVLKGVIDSNRIPTVLRKKSEHPKYPISQKDFNKFDYVSRESLKSSHFAGMGVALVADLALALGSLYCLGIGAKSLAVIAAAPPVISVLANIGSGIYEKIRSNREVKKHNKSNLESRAQEAK
jgi:hypothetical protein